MHVPALGTRASAQTRSAIPVGLHAGPTSCLGGQPHAARIKLEWHAPCRTSFARPGPCITARSGGHCSSSIAVHGPRLHRFRVLFLLPVRPACAVTVGSKPCILTRLQRSAMPWGGLHCGSCCRVLTGPPPAPPRRASLCTPRRRRWCTRFRCSPRAHDAWSQRARASRSRNASIRACAQAPYASSCCAGTTPLSLRACPSRGR